MKRFRFSLRPVAGLREHDEALARDSFAAAVRASNQAELQLAHVRRRVAQLEEALFAARRSRFSAAFEVNGLAAHRRECAAEAEAAGRFDQARAALEQRRLEYLEARRRMEVIRRLESRARLEHRLAAAREEQAELDEFSARRTAPRPLSSPC